MLRREFLGRTSEAGISVALAGIADKLPKNEITLARWPVVFAIGKHSISKKDLRPNRPYDTEKTVLVLGETGDRHLRMWYGWESKDNQTANR